MRNTYIVNAPSEDFSGINAALPLGNGYMGMQVEDNIVYERLALNESTLWSGGPYDNDLNGAYASLKELRESAFKDRQRDFDWESKFVSQWGGQIMLPAGDFMAYFANSRETSNYQKQLDLRRGILTTTFEKQGERVEKRYFANYPSRVICIRYQSDRKAMNFACEIASKSSGSLTVEGDTLLFHGAANGARGVDGAIRYTIAARLRTDGELWDNGKRIFIKNAGTTEIYLSIVTNFVSDGDLSAPHETLARALADKAYARGYEALEKEHSADFSALYDRVSLRLGKETGDVPVKELQRRFAEEDDCGWVELYFNFTRYLILSSTRNGAQPPSLQGKWNDKLSPPWDCKYTVNINLQMNYWSLAPLGLSELYDSLLEKMKAVAKKGKKTARETYGIERGDSWVLHHNTDLWNVCAPIDGCWGLTPVCGAWLMNELFTAYEYTGNEDFLRELYPLFRGCAQFFCEFLVPFGEYLVTCPSTSPERMNGALGYVTYGSAHDNQIVREMFEHYLVCERLVRADAALEKETEEKLKKLPPPAAVSKCGLVREFYFHDFDYLEDTHRHLAHLYGVYPGNSVFRQHDGELDAAVKKTLDCRSTAGDWTGWGIVWRIALYARLGDGAAVAAMLKTFLDRRNGLMLENGFGALPYENGSAFQYDCNGAFPAALLETLVRSEEGRVTLLPALPDFLRDGELKGVCLRGAFRLEKLVFTDGKVARCDIYSEKGGRLEIAAGGRLYRLDAEADRTYTVIGSSI